MEGSDGWRRLRSATLCRASLRYGGERVSGRVRKNHRKDIGKSAGEWHFDLEGKDKRWHE